MYPAGFEDMTGISDTVSHLFGQVSAAMLTFEEAHEGVMVISYTSDAAANSRKAREMLTGWRPDLILLDCMAQMVPSLTYCPRIADSLLYCCRWRY